MASSAALYSKGQPFVLLRTGVSDANYTMTVRDYIVGLTVLSANRTVTLPPNPIAGRRVIVKDESGSCANNCTITIAGTIDGTNSLVLSTAYAFCELYANGSGWSKVVAG